MTLKSKLRGKASAKNIVLGIAYLTLFCTIIAQCSLTIKMHQCVGSGDAETCGFGDKDPVSFDPLVLLDDQKKTKQPCQRH